MIPVGIVAPKNLASLAEPWDDRAMPIPSRMVERKPARSTRVYYRYDRHGDVVEVSAAELQREPGPTPKQGAFVLQGELRCLTGNRSG